MSNLKELRLRAGYSIAQLARQAGIDRGTVTRAEQGIEIQDAKAYMILQALSIKLGREVTFKDVDDLKVRGL